MKVIRIFFYAKSGWTHNISATIIATYILNWPWGKTSEKNKKKHKNTTTKKSQKKATFEKNEQKTYRKKS